MDDALSASGTWRKVGSVVPVRESVLRFNPVTGTATGFMSQSEADMHAEIKAFLDPLMWTAPPWDVTTVAGTCATRVPCDLGGGMVADLICSLPPNHGGGHEPLDTQGRVMPLSPLLDDEAA